MVGQATAAKCCITGAQLGPSSSSHWRGQTPGAKRNLRQDNFRGTMQPARTKAQPQTPNLGNPISHSHNHL